MMKKQAQICEVALICGMLSERGAIDTGDRTLVEMYNEIYLPIFHEWEGGVGTEIFENSEEEGCISAYAQRRLLELYPAI